MQEALSLRDRTIDNLLPALYPYLIIQMDVVKQLI